MFWTHIFKYWGAGGSGENPRIDGWFCSFFPYIDNRRSKFAQRSVNRIIEDIKAGDYPAKEEFSDSDEEFMMAEPMEHGLD